MISSLNILLPCSPSIRLPGYIFGLEPVMFVLGLCSNLVALEGTDLECVTVWLRTWATVLPHLK